MSLDAQVAIVGAGPIGLELAVALQRRGVSVLHLDAKQVGYTISWFAPQTRFFSSNDRIAIAGVPIQTVDQSKATREEYLAYLRRVVIQNDLKIRTFEPVTDVRPTDDGFIIHTSPAAGPAEYRVRQVVLATGGTDRPRRLNIPGEDLPHVSHYFRDPHLYFRRRVVVVGGKNSAVEAALRCQAIGADVSIVHRRPSLPTESIKYWLTPEIASLLKSGKIRGHFSSTIREIRPNEVILGPAGPDGSAIDGPTTAIPADVVLLLVGYEQDKRLFERCGITLAGPEQAPAFDEQTMQTSVPGIYVAGTATGGTQTRYTVFIENCHVHVDRIVAAVTRTDGSPGAPPPSYDLPES